MEFPDLFCTEFTGIQPESHCAGMSSAVRNPECLQYFPEIHGSAARSRPQSVLDFSAGVRGIVIGCDADFPGAFSQKIRYGFDNFDKSLSAVFLQKICGLRFGQENGARLFGKMGNVQRN